MNLIVALVFGLILKILVSAVPAILTTSFGHTIFMMFYYVIIINISLMLFNLLPIPPFDGSRVFFAFLPQKYYFAIMQYEQYIMIGLLILMYTGILAIPFEFIADANYALLDLITKFIC